MTSAPSPTDPTMPGNSASVSRDRRSVYATVGGPKPRYYQSPGSNAEETLSPSRLLQEINRTGSQQVFAWRFLVGGLLVSGLLLRVRPIFSLAILGLALVAAAITHKRDRERRTFPLLYQFEGEGEARWERLNTTLDTLQKTDRLWAITVLTSTYDWKHATGIVEPESRNAISRTTATLARQRPTTLVTNLLPYCLNAGARRYYFLPDRLYIEEGNQYQSVDYAALRVDSGQVRLLEESSLPADATVLSHVPRHLIKNGGKNDGGQIPIASYGVVEIAASPDFSLLLHVSSLAVAESFTKAFDGPPETSKPSAPPRASGSLFSNVFRAFADRETPHTNETIAIGPTIEECCALLNLPVDCTREEAAARYRELAMINHPDRVSQADSETKEQALQKLKDINIAYTELKHLRDW